MFYPKPLKSGSTIAVCAFSSGVDTPYQARLDLALETLDSKGFKLVLDPNLRKNSGFVSASKEVRATQLMQYLLDDTIDAIMPPWGGEFAMEILPHLDFSALKHAKPKWIIGFSDVSTLQVALTTELHWASMHTTNLMQFVPAQSDKTTNKFFQAITLNKKESFVQIASEKYESKGVNIIDNPGHPFNLDSTTHWKTLNLTEKGMSGRLIGGCLDILIMTLDTPYFNLPRFCEQYPEQGVLLYIENAELSPTTWLRVLLSLKYKGIFDQINGLLIGRHTPNDTDSTLTFEMALKQADISVPIIYDMDIGHLPPNLTVINGAFCEISKQLELKQTLI